MTEIASARRPHLPGFSETLNPFDFHFKVVLHFSLGNRAGLMNTFQETTPIFIAQSKYLIKPNKRFPTKIVSNRATNGTKNHLMPDNPAMAAQKTVINSAWTVINGEILPNISWSFPAEALDAICDSLSAVWAELL